MSGPYTPKNAPRLFGEYGEEFVTQRINPFVRKVQTAITMMPRGGEVQYVEVSGQTKPERVVAFADFAKGLRLWFREGKIDEPVPDVWNGPRLNETVPD